MTQSSRSPNRRQMEYSAQIDGAVIVDWESFHGEFQKQMGFFDGYGKNMDAWNDCMRDMYTNGEYKSLTKFDLHDGDTFTLVVMNAAQWKRTSPEIYSAFEDCSLFCNSETLNFEVRIQN